MLFIGGLAGWVAARALKAGKQNSVVVYVFIGAIGSVIGKLILEFVGFEVVGGGVIVDFVVAFVGAVVLVGVSKLIAEKIIK